MELLPEWAPNIHPILVHFPIAILSIAILFDFISLFFDRDNTWWTQKATAFLYGIGAVAAIIVYYTGTVAADSVMLPAEAQSVLSEHANMAWYTIWFYGIYAVARIAAVSMVDQHYQRKIHIGFFLVSLVGMFLLYETGDHGAEMVFKHGVGVQAADVENPVGNSRSSKETSAASQDSARDDSSITSFQVTDNGGWNWDINEKAVSALNEQFQWLSGSAEAANAKAIETENGHALSFSGDDLNVFIAGQNSYKSEQVDYHVDMSSFEGTVLFVTHVKNVNNYDFVSIASDGTIQQGRINGVEQTVFEEGTTDTSAPLFVRVVGDGTHFRGYVNEEMIVHGHGDAPQPGRVGLKLEGSGKVLLRKMSVTPL